MAGKDRHQKRSGQPMPKIPKGGTSPTRTSRGTARPSPQTGGGESGARPRGAQPPKHKKKEG